MENIEIKINKETRMVNISKKYVGNDGENLQGKLTFSFVDEFVNGQARLEYIINNIKYYALLDKEEETYTLPIKSILTKKGQIDMQLVITEGTNVEEIPIFKSNIFYLYCRNSINAETPEPEEYSDWIDIIDVKLNQMDTINLEVEKVDNTAIITFTRKDGSTHSVEIHDGVGSEGQGTYNYLELENKPSINGIELVDDKSLSDLGIDQDFVKDENYVHTDNNFSNSFKNQIETNQNNIETLSNAIEEHDGTLQNMQNDIDTIEQDIDSIGTEIDNLDTNKQDKLISGENIKTINNVSILGNGNINIQALFSGLIIELEEYQYTYDNYILPAIDVEQLREIYTKDSAGMPLTLHWSLYGSDNNFKIVSSDHIANEYSIDILVHNKYHCAYTWTDETTGIVNPTISTQI